MFSVATRKTVLHTTNTKLSDRGKTENEFKEFIGTILKNSRNTCLTANGVAGSTLGFCFCMVSSSCLCFQPSQPLEREKSAESLFQSKVLLETHVNYNFNPLYITV